MPLLSTDAVDFRLTKDWDIFLGPHGFETIAGADGVAQMCGIALKLFLKEWFLNRAKGVDWFTLFQSKFVESVFREALRQTLASVPGVDQVVSIAVSVDGQARRGAVDATVHTTFGDVSFSDTFGS